MYLQNENSHFSEEITSNIVVQTNKVMFFVWSGFVWFYHNIAYVIKSFKILSLFTIVEKVILLLIEELNFRRRLVSDQETLERRT